MSQAPLNIFTNIRICRNCLVECVQTVIFTATWAARSSAFWVRRIRIEPLMILSDVPTEVPKISVWMMIDDRFLDDHFSHQLIRVTVDDLVVEVRSDELAIASFSQAYQSDTYSDEVQKSLTWGRVGESWKILVEATVPP